MLLSYMTRINKDGEDYIDLCIIPDKPDNLSIPTSVFMLTETVAAVYRVGPEEAFITNLDTDGALIIQAMEPAGLYLTLNVAIRPGLRVRRIKLFRNPDRTCRVQYEKDRGGWIDYQANLQRT